MAPEMTENVPSIPHLQAFGKSPPLSGLKNFVTSKTSTTPPDCRPTIYCKYFFV